MENIELRSEKVRNIIGEIPPVLIRCGAGIIALLLAGLITAACLIPYPETLAVQAEVEQTDGNGNRLVCLIPYGQVTKINKGMKATIEMEGYDAHEYGYLQSHVTCTDRQVYRQNDRNYFRIILTTDSPKTPYPLQKGMRGTATLLLTDQSLMRHLLPRL